MKKLEYIRPLVVGLLIAGFVLLTLTAVRVGREDAAQPSATPVLAREAAEAHFVAVAESGVGVPWDLPAVKNDEVRKWIKFLTTEKRDKFHLWLERWGRYAPLIQHELRQRGMPTDLIYLAMIESGFQVNAYSSAAAVGIWQFIESTAEIYGLTVNEYVDQRRDPIAATDAALDYLQDLYDMFDSWYLAAASYNTGEHRVARIMREHFGHVEGADSLFWEIDEDLPWETRAYVPLMLAAGYIGKHPEKYGFDLDDIELQEPLAFEVVRVPGGVPLRTVARAAGVEPEAVRRLNPHLIKEITPPGEASFPVRIPIGTRQTFASNFDEVRDRQRLASTEHVVERGETLIQIAERYGTTVDAIQAANNGLDPQSLAVGQRIRIPGAGVSAESGSESSDAVAAAENTAEESEPEWTFHRVRTGDTLWDIARRYGVSVDELREWNDLRGNVLQPGQRLRVRA